MNFLRNFKHAKRLFKNKQCNVLRQSTALVSVKAFPHTKMPVSGFEGNLTNLMKRKKNTLKTYSVVKSLKIFL